MASSRLDFQAVQHVRFCLRCLQMLPTPYQQEECSRMSLAYFALSSLDLLGATTKLKEKDKQDYIDWVYAQQLPAGGFRGGPFVGLENTFVEPAHIVMSYTAILILAILGDDLSKLNYSGMLDFVTRCQAPDGSFAPFPNSQERDVRFVYCAFVICKLFDAMDLIDVESALNYLESCRSYDYAYGQRPGLEAQGGTTYCCIASYALAGRLSDLAHKERTLSWLSHRFVPLDPRSLDEDDFQTEDDAELLARIEEGNVRITGFQGRPEKDPDACYSFWVSASINLLSKSVVRFHDSRQETSFLLLCQAPRIGGIAKFPGELPDIYHTYLALAALSVGQLEGLRQIDSTINLATHTLENMESRIRRVKTSRCTSQVQASAT